MTFAFSLFRYYYDYYDDYLSSAICHTDCDGSESRLSECNIQRCSETENYSCFVIIFVECCKENSNTLKEITILLLFFFRFWVLQ